MSRTMLARILGAALAASMPSFIAAQGIKALKDKIKVVEKLGAQVPLDARFSDEQGKPVVLRQFFKNRPVVLLMLYYKCGGTCNKALEEAASTFKAMKTWDIGREYEVVTVSVHPKEGAKLASLQDGIYAEKYARPTGQQGWHFLTGSYDQIRKLTDSVGFYYLYDEKTNRIMHPNTLVVLTPQGKVSQYFNGLIYPPRMVLTALQTAKKAEIGVYDPTEPTGCIQAANSGKYTALVNNILRAVGVLFLLGAGGAIFAMSRRRSSQDVEGGAP